MIYFDAHSRVHMWCSTALRRSHDDVQLCHVSLWQDSLHCSPVQQCLRAIELKTVLPLGAGNVSRPHAILPGAALDL